MGRTGNLLVQIVESKVIASRVQVGALRMNPAVILSTFSEIAGLRGVVADVPPAAAAMRRIRLHPPAVGYACSLLRDVG